MRVSTNALASGGAAAIGLKHAMPASDVFLYSGSDGLSSAAKGRLGEYVMDKVMTKEFLRGTGNWVSSPARNSIHGLDGLYLRADSQGRIRNPLVVEAKYNTSRLGMTKDGLQMSDGWIRPRMSTPAQIYRDTIWESGDSVIERTIVPENVDSIAVPLSGSQTADVWKENDVYNVRVPKGYTTADIKRQLKNAAKIVEGAGDGVISYRSRLFNYNVEEGTHRITLTHLGKDGNPVVGTNGAIVREVIDYKPGELPEKIREGIQSAFQSTLEDEGVPSPVAKKLAKFFADNPDFAETVGLTTRDGRYIRYTMGTVHALGVAAISGILSVLVQATSQRLFDGEVDWDSTKRQGAMVALSSGTGYVFGAAIHGTLINTTVGQQLVKMMPVQHIAGQSISRVLGTAGGAVIGSTVYLAGMYFLGEMGGKQSKRMLTRSTAQVIAAKGAAVTAVGGATALGTASTGTAISSLSGAAAKNAALAWWGGGSIASGGFGMTGGMVVLGGIGAAAGVVAVASTGYVFRKMDEAEQMTTVKARLSIVENRISEGIQPEWQ